MPITVRRATLADATRLSALGAATVREAFADANTPQDLAASSAEAFSPEQQARELRDPASVILLAENEPPPPPPREEQHELVGMRT